MTTLTSINITVDGQPINLHGTCQLGQYYTGEVSAALVDALANATPIERNDSYTLFDDMVFYEVEFTDDEGDEYILSLSYDIDPERSISEHVEFQCDEDNYQIKAA